MSRPEWPASTHAQYKEDTGVFTTWLAEHAEKTGFALPPPVDQGTVKRGKSKKKHVKAPLVQVTVRELVEPALHVVKQQPQVLVPHEIFEPLGTLLTPDHVAQTGSRRSLLALPTLAVNYNDRTKATRILLRC
jgi:hypothetical protein